MCGLEKEVDRFRFSKRGQVTIFVIIAIAIVGLLIAFFVLRGAVDQGSESEDIRGVYSYYEGCIGQELRAGLQVAGMQGGKIFVDEYAPGSEYAPFSSELNFLGTSVPYWSYVAGNGLIKEQVPSKNEIEEELELYVRENLDNCDFLRFYEQGFGVTLEGGDVSVDIRDKSVLVKVEGDLLVEKGEDKGIKREHEVEVSSKFGSFYDQARQIYSAETENRFFEEYGVDVLRNYAPVDGVEIQCGPEIWNTREVIDNLKSGLEGNMGALKFRGDYYDIVNEKGDYFVIDVPVEEQVNVLYDGNWPTKIEIVGDGVDEDLIIAEPVGNQAGLSAMGFCYVPYHYVYDLSYPVMVQIYNENELFQFSTVVVIDNNLPIEGIQSELSFLEGEQEDLCEFKTKDVEIRLFDNNLNVAEGNVSYQCFDQRCRLGETENGVLKVSAPTCYNGELLVRGSGFNEKKQLFSTNRESRADVVLDREIDVEVSVSVDGVLKEDNVFFSFTSEGRSVTGILPEASKVSLKEGFYEIKVYAYGDSEIVMPKSTRRECRDVPRSGLAGLFGGTTEECFNIELPETKIEYALIGGGQGEEFLLESELEKGELTLSVAGLPEPKSIEELQQNFIAFEAGFVRIE